jgi:hypothetical protein
MLDQPSASQLPEYPDGRPNPDVNSKEYYEYLMMCQRNSESNFIQYMDSGEIVYNPISSVKIIGPYALGDVIGKGEFFSSSK